MGARGTELRQRERRHLLLVRLDEVWVQRGKAGEWADQAKKTSRCREEEMRAQEDQKEAERQAEVGRLVRKGRRGGTEPSTSATS